MVLFIRGHAYCIQSMCDLGIRIQTIRRALAGCNQWLPLFVNFLFCLYCLVRTDALLNRLLYFWPLKEYTIP